METKGLEKIYLDLIDSAIKVSLSISDLYNKLYELEVKGEKNTDKYDTYIDFLNDCVDTYNELFEEANLKPKKCREIIEYIQKNISTYNTNLDIDSLLEQDYDERHIRRILNTLQSIYFNDEKYYEDMFPPELKELLEKYGIIVHQGIELNEIVKKDYLNGFITIIQDTINHNTNKKFNNNLINSKYNISYICKDIEKAMIESKFNPSEQYGTSSNLTAALVQLDDKSFNNVKDEIFTNFVTNQIDSILELKDEDYIDERKASSSLLRSCFLRTAFSFISEATLENINFNYHKQIEDKEYVDKHRNDKISEAIISKAFMNIKKDKEKQVGIKVKPFNF